MGVSQQSQSVLVRPCVKNYLFPGLSESFELTPKSVCECESDRKVNEEVFEFNSASMEYEGELYCDAISGEAMIKELVEAARKVEMEKFKKHGVYEKVPIEERWKSTGEALVGVKRVDANKGDKGSPEYMCRLVAKEIKKDRWEDLVAVAPSLEAKKITYSLWARMPGMCLDFGDVPRAYYQAKARRRVCFGFAHGL
jgi:hypothetical protein